MKLQIAVSQASLIFQKRFLDTDSSANRSNIPTTNQKIFISKIRKNCPLKPSYVEPLVIIYLEKLSIQFALLKTLSIFDTNRCQGKFYDIDRV